MWLKISIFMNDHHTMNVEYTDPCSTRLQSGAADLRELPRLLRQERKAPPCACSREADSRVTKYAENFFSPEIASELDRIGAWGISPGYAGARASNGIAFRTTAEDLTVA